MCRHALVQTGNNLHIFCFFKEKCQANKTVGKGTTTKPDGLSLILRTHVVERETHKIKKEINVIKSF